MAKNLASSNLPFQVFEGFIGKEPKTKNNSILVKAFLENPLFVLFIRLLDLVDPGACYGYFFLLPFS